MLFMRALNSQRICRGVALAALLVAAQARAIVAYDYPDTLVANHNDFEPLILANRFDVISPINVTAVGAFDSGNNGFFNGATAVAVPVAMYQLTDPSHDLWSQVAGTIDTFTGKSGSLTGPTTQVGSALFQNLDQTVTLTPGTYAIVAANYGTTGVHYWGWSSNPSGVVPTFTSDSSVEMGNSLNNGNNGINLGSSFPADPLFLGPGFTASSPIPSFAGATFEFEPVPEAATFGAAGVGLLGLVYIGRYARLRRIGKPA
jgi:hypothetical protein